MAVRERMEEVQRKTSAKTQATQSEGSRGQEPTTSCRRAPGQGQCQCQEVRSCCYKWCQRRLSKFPHCPEKA